MNVLLTEPLVITPEIRIVHNGWGEDEEILSSRTCCVCNNQIWVTNNIGRQTMSPYAFNVLNPEAYVNGIVPDYIKNSHVLLQCHYTCKKKLYKQLEEGSFIPR